MIGVNIKINLYFVFRFIFVRGLGYKMLDEWKMR